MDDVLVVVTRKSGYWREGRHYPKGCSLEVPEPAARAMEAARPPFGRRVTPDELEALTAPIVDATPEAAELAKDRGLDLRPFAGRGSGPDGRIYKRDVETWKPAPPA